MHTGWAFKSMSWNTFLKALQIDCFLYGCSFERKAHPPAPRNENTSKGGCEAEIQQKKKPRKSEGFRHKDVPEWDPDLWDPWTNNNTRLRRPRPLSKPHSSECLFPFSPKHFPWPDACLRSDGRTACQADPSSLTVSSWRLIEHNTGTDRKR